MENCLNVKVYVEKEGYESGQESLEEEVFGYKLSAKTLESYEEHIIQTFRKLVVLESLDSNPAFLLELASKICKNESGFIQINSYQVLERLILIAQPTKLETGDNVKGLFLKMLNTILTHTSGVGWSVATNYWMDAFCILRQYQNMGDSYMLVKGYDYLATLLQQSFKTNRQFATNIFNFLTNPLLMAAKTPKLSNSDSVTSFSPRMYKDVTSHGLCLVEILERLIENEQGEIMKLFTSNKIAETCDEIAQLPGEPELTVLMYRIEVMLNFYHLHALFDGIQVIHENGLVLSGLYQIFEREINRDNITTIIEIGYYTLKYLKNEHLTLPKLMVNNNTVKMETELLCFVLEPVCCLCEILSESFASMMSWEKIKKLSHIALFHESRQVMQEYSTGIYNLGYRFREKIYLQLGSAIYLHSLDYTYRSINYFSKPNVRRLALVLALTLENGFIFFLNVVQKRIISYEEQMVMEKLMDVISGLLQSLDADSVQLLKLFDLPTTLHNLLYYINWSSPIVVKGLRLLKLIITKKISPEMLMLIDSVDDSGMRDVGQMLFVKLFSSDFEIRQMALSVVSVIARTAHESFPSFREILTKAGLPEVVATFSSEDRNPLVRAAAFRCLQDLVMLESEEEDLFTFDLMEKVLEALESEIDPEPRAEAVHLLSKIFWQKSYTEQSDHFSRIFVTLERIAFTDTDYTIQKEVLKFWRKVESYYMRSVGWTDNEFPKEIFDKKIIKLTPVAIKRRIFSVLSDLSSSGCLRVITHFLNKKNAHEEVLSILNQWLQDISNIYHKYQITEESMQALEEDHWINITVTESLSPSSSESNCKDDDDLMMDIVNNLLLNDDPEDGNEPLQPKHRDTEYRMSPSVFVHLIQAAVRGGTEDGVPD